MTSIEKLDQLLEIYVPKNLRNRAAFRLQLIELLKRVNDEQC